MSLKALSDFTTYSKYALHIKSKQRRETWDEMVDRVFDMHAKRYAKELAASEELRNELDFAKLQVRKKRVLGSARILQFGGDQIFKHNEKVYNCCFGYIDRVKAFQEAFYLLLCGCGVGASLQKKHIAKLPDIQPIGEGLKIFKPDDSIEGWADCLGVLMSSYFKHDQMFPEYAGYDVQFDFSNIRPEGTLIAGQFKAPGPAGLAKALELVRGLINKRLADGLTRLRPIDVYDILMHISDAVLSGGVRRSAMICLFSLDDIEMMTAKIGNWHETNPQRGRSNNSVVLIRDQVTAEQFASIIESTKQCGEPGFVWADNEDCGFNPCISGSSLISTSLGEIRMDMLVDRVNAGEDIKVKSFDIKTGNSQMSSITAAALTRKSAQIIEIEFEDGKTLTLTPDHRVFTSNRGYVEADKLTPEDNIVSLDQEHTDYKYTYEIGISANWKAGLQYDNETGVQVVNFEGLGEIQIKPDFAIQARHF